jgi:hypothetical protein
LVGIDRLQFDALDESLFFRALGLRLDVHPTGSLPDSRHAGKGAKVLQRIAILN